MSPSTRARRHDRRLRRAIAVVPIVIALAGCDMVTAQPDSIAPTPPVDRGMGGGSVAVSLR
ncbi:hypothetical protein [Agromyces rhizosphaerae]|uniref:hypothetical protein n=1 Tax=Agromyces rhizosphaerae TaxID=88374 RepID=UPI00249197DD|nr:hypothetical protein [Agromyces rhizosphaerae]